MADKLKLELVSPERLLASKEVDTVLVPGVEGYFGVLPHHSPLLSTLKPGIIEIYEDEGGSPERLFVAGGFAEVGQNGCTILAEEALPLNELDGEALTKQVSNLVEDYEDEADEHERQKIAASLEIAKAKLAAIDNPRVMPGVA